MEPFENFRSEGPVEYALRTGDTSRGVTPDDIGLYKKHEWPPLLPDHEHVSTNLNSWIALALSIAFLTVAILSW